MNDTGSSGDHRHHSSQLRLTSGTSRHATDLDDARQLVARSMCDHRLKLAGRRARLDAHILTRRLRTVSFSNIGYGGDVDIIPGRLRTFAVVQIPIIGQGLVRCGPQQVHTRPGHASVVTPTRPLSQRWSGDCEQMVVRYERWSLEAHLSDLLGEPVDAELTFDLGLDLAGPGGTLLDAVTGAIGALNRDDDLLDHDLALATMEHNLMSTLLLTTHNSYTTRLTSDAPTASSQIVREVVDLIESHPEHPHTVASLARAHGVSVRTLERSFARDLGTTPAAYLRTVRLSRVHDMLRAAPPDGITVAHAAHTWGFVNLGRFARDYRELFGEHPSHTRMRR